MHTILGAGGAIGHELGEELIRKGERVRFVSRNPRPVKEATEVVAADLSDLEATVDAIAGSAVAYLVAGLKYDVRVWQELWPRIMQNTIEACKRANAKLIFLDNVYMYGRVSGAMTESTQFNPCSKKGEIRAHIATMLLKEMQSGSVRALIARSADFYGPHTTTSVPGILVFDKFSRGKSASWLVNDSVRHSYSFTPDIGKSLAMLAEDKNAWGQTWHVPTAPDPPTGKEFIGMIAREFGVQPKYTTLSQVMLKLAGMFDTTIRESYEMLYQSKFEYIFDSTTFNNTFEFKPTSYVEGVKQTVASYRL